MAFGRFSRTGQSAPPSRAPQVCVLDADPDLARCVPPHQLADARRHLIAPMITLPRGAWHSEFEGFDPEGLGLLVLDGLLRRRVVLGSGVSAELLGEGDLLTPSQRDEGDASVPVSCQWTVCAPAPVAILNAQLTERLATWPSVLAQLAGRLTRRSQGLAVRMAIAQVPGVELRVQLLFWHLADRWGHVAVEGVVLPLRPDQETIGNLAGISRTRVNMALRVLEREGALQRRDGGWLLQGERPQRLLGGHVVSAQTRVAVPTFAD